MAEITRRGPKDMSGVEFYELDGVDIQSFCPDSNDASTRATQVHLSIVMKSALKKIPELPMILRFHGTDSLDAIIEALIEHRTYVFGAKEFGMGPDGGGYEVQEDGPSPNHRRGM